MSIYEAKYQASTFSICDWIRVRTRGTDKHKHKRQTDDLLEAIDLVVLGQQCPTQQHRTQDPKQIQRDSAALLDISLPQRESREVSAAD
jgi:hypothetical protein